MEDTPMETDDQVPRTEGHDARSLEIIRKELEELLILNSGHQSSDHFESEMESQTSSVIQGSESCGENDSIDDDPNFSQSETSPNPPMSAPTTEIQSPTNPTFKVFPPKLLDGVEPNQTLYLTRAQPEVYQICYYNLPDSGQPHLEINLQSVGNSKKQSECGKGKDKKEDEDKDKDKTPPPHGGKCWIIYGDNIGVPLGEPAMIDLEPNRCNTDVSLKFPCNTSCTTMFRKSKLTFSLFVGSTCISTETFTLKVGERSNRNRTEHDETVQ
jgi:hypothetical protein